MPHIDDGVSIELGMLHKRVDGDIEIKGSENPMLSLSRVGRVEKASSGSIEAPSGFLRGAIGVPMPPSDDWEGYNDPKYKAQKEMTMKEDETNKSVTMGTG